jgi:hypothetical protein
VNDRSKLQANVLNKDEAVAHAETAGLKPEEYVSTLSAGLLSHPAAMERISASFPKWSKLVDSWTETPLKNLRLTSVGIAIAHSNWSNRTGGDASLSIWLPDS